jgi:ribosomal protein S18 acetylase RimI-like enzyme
MSSPLVRHITLDDVASFRACVDAVMRERQYLAFFEAFSPEQTTQFVVDNIANGNPQFVAIDHGEVVGWCDVRRDTVPVYNHSGHLGMGVAKDFRGRGIGQQLIEATLLRAQANGFERIELSVYAKNIRARSLYEKVGFKIEGTRIRGKKADGEYDDVHMMALLF